VRSLFRVTLFYQSLFLDWDLFPPLSLVSIVPTQKYTLLPGYLCPESPLSRYLDALEPVHSQKQLLIKPSEGNDNVAVSCSRWSSIVEVQARHHGDCRKSSVLRLTVKEYA
jgi:hypothetical protein